MPDDNGKNKEQDIKNSFPLTGQMKERLESSEVIPFSELSDVLRNVIEKISGIQVDSDESLREAADIIRNRETDSDVELAVRDIEARALRMQRKGVGPCCSLCGRSEKEVSQLFAGQNGSICNRCLEARI